ncbi:MAG TPA: MarR family transcriptional regulator [Acidobacteriota bacterium]|nr:MarR family transcriptional regulator [Acidobacteriota bacterium]
MKRQPEGGFLIGKIHRLSHRILTRKLKDYQINLINPAQGRIMFVVWRKDGLSISDLARETSLGKSTLTSMLDRLEKAGHLKRVPSQDDRRKLLIRRTRKDRAAEETYKAVSKKMTKLFYSGFSKHEIGQFEGYLQKILANLTASDLH